MKNKSGCPYRASQCSRILEMLRYARREHDSVEWVEIANSGCFKIEASIRELRRRGFVIEGSMSEGCDGNVYTHYFLTHDPERDQNGR